MMRDIAPGFAAPVPLLSRTQRPPQQRQWPRPVDGVAIAGRFKHQLEECRERSPLDDEGAVHIGFAKPQLRVEQYCALRRSGREAHRDRFASPVAEGMGGA